MTVKIEAIDYGAQGEYGFFGKRVAFMVVDDNVTEAEVIKFKKDMRYYYGNDIHFREVEADS